jgi:4-amino-4-deoxy-L-arabinose transferase-like glycosyltransferase
MSQEPTVLPHPERLQATAVVALAFVLRVAWVALVPTKPVGDFAMYIESAHHLIEHGRFDDQYVYMPGYVLLLALVKLCGGGLGAAKAIGVAAGAVTAGAVYGIAWHLWDRRTALVAGIFAAVWPGGIAVASVTGTDMPATALVVVAICMLVRGAKARPVRAVVGFGVLMGLATYVRAVALPLSALAAVVLLATGLRPRRAIAMGAMAVAIAFVVILPWGVRNRVKYGEWVLTDSHGGLTALVGAYPNTDGRYTRALNRGFAEVTGHAWLSEPHREADRRAYEWAHVWRRTSPAYTAGLAIGRAEKLLADERSLLYWPLYRAGVLRDPPLAFFSRWRRRIEWGTDGFYAFVMTAALAGMGLAAARRQWLALSLVPMQGALGAVYVAFFAETRYHLPIVALAMPAAAGAITGLARWTRDHTRAMAYALATPVLAWTLWLFALPYGATLRDRHRFAVSSCQVNHGHTFCSWSRADNGRGPSPVQGVFDGVGIRVGDTCAARAAMTVSLPSGQHRITAHVDAGPIPGASGGDAVVSITASPGGLLFETPLSALLGPTLVKDGLDRVIETQGGPVRILLAVNTSPALGLRGALAGISRAPPPACRATVWLTNLRIGPEAPR